jgi:hypothetical protein
MCCKLFNIEELNKPAHKWCQHCNPSQGCKIYPTRPETCVDYQCLWLRSQASEIKMAEALRPNKCKIVFELNGNGTLLVAHVDRAYPGNINNPEVVRFLEAVQRTNVVVYVSCGEQQWIFGHKDDKEYFARVEDSIVIH